MNEVKALPAAALFRKCDADRFEFETTEELEGLGEMIGLDRAAQALSFGTGIQRKGFNLFALGPPGLGKFSTIHQYACEKAASQPVPSDWCYVNNFEHPNRPKAIALPAGRGQKLQKDVNDLIQELQTVLPSVFETDDYRTRKQSIEEEFKERQEEAFESLREKAQQRGFGLLTTPLGLMFAPIRDGEVMNPEDFKKLPPEEQKRLNREIAELQSELQALLRQLPQWEREGREKVRQLNQEVSRFSVRHLIDELKEKYAELPAVVEFLEAVQSDIVENTDQILRPQPATAGSPLGLPTNHGGQRAPFLRRYLVNLLVSHDDGKGAPVVYEDHPTYQNLVGQVEHLATMGALVTDFNLIKAGALHRANNGFLILDAARVLVQPYAWEGLKRVLKAGELRIESLGQALSLISTVSLEPQPIPLDVKVILMGERLLYYLLCELDPEFLELFKVSVDFEEELDRNQDNDRLFARLVATLARRDELLPLNRSGVARVVEYSSRLVEDSEKLSLHKGNLCDLLKEADYRARQNGRSLIDGADIEQAIDAKIFRSDRLRQRIQEEIQRRNILIETEGETVGQVNALSVIRLGQFTFGKPSRITARIWLGKEGVVDIEREVELGGPLHSKGVLILSGYLGARFASRMPMSLSASLVFEQSYGSVEGDSASSAELYALLSALAEVPIRQSLAVTGSVNQLGEVQAIGGVNQKIEGFFDVCRMRGLTGRQGVLIPSSNVKNLMLRREVLESAEAGRFHIYPVSTIEQGIELLTGVSIGVPDDQGNFPEGTIGSRVQARLKLLAETQAEYGGRFLYQKEAE